MKDILIKFKQHPHYDKIINWGKLISITGSAQIIVQAVAFASGILIIRLLSVQEYAFYTLTNTMLGTITVLADSGISTGVMAQGGRVWQDKEKLGTVLATGLDLRKKFGIISLVVSIPILFYLLKHNGASTVTALLLILALIPAFYAALSDSLLEIVPKLHQTILPLQKNAVGVGLGRLLLTATTIFVFPWAFIAVLAAGIPRIFGNINLRKISYDLADKNQKPDKDVRTEILALVRRIMPTSIYYCVSGQITIWLISIFGNTNSIAQLGALGRLSMVLSLFGVIVSTLIIPRFARLASNKYLLLQRFIQVILVSTVLYSIVILTVYLFPSPILWLLGDAYKGLPFELLLSVVGSCIGLLTGIVFSLYNCRGWAFNPIIGIPLGGFGIILGAVFFELTSLLGALYYNLFLAGYSFIVNIGFAFYCLYSIKNND